MAAELNIEDRDDLQHYLHDRFAPREEFEIIDFAVLAGGVSSRTVRVSLSGGQAWVLKQALAKLRVETDWFSDPRRVHREALGMQVLGELTPPGSVPRLIFDDERHHVLAMEAVPQPHENWKTRMLAGRAESRHAGIFGALLGGIHSRSRSRADELATAFADRTFFESLRVEPYYVYSAAQEPRAAPFYKALIAETRATATALVHGDYSPKNVLIHDDRLVLLDHEVIHWGDPGFDVGFALTHFLSKAHHRPLIRIAFVDIAIFFYTSYKTTCGFVDRPVEHESSCVRHTLGCLLARVVGRSPLEYLSPEERERQSEAVVCLMGDVPTTISELIARFTQEIESRE